MKKGAFRNFIKFTGKHSCQGLFFNKVVGLSPATSLKDRLWHRCFPVNFAKFLRTLFLQNTSWRLLLEVAFSFTNITELTLYANKLKSFRPLGRQSLLKNKSQV